MLEKRFETLTRSLEPTPGCWNVGIINTVTGLTTETQGDILKVDYGWSDFLDWLKGDIAEMDAGDPEDIDVMYINYAGKLDEDVITYNGYDIDCFGLEGYVVVNYCGDEIVFESVAAAVEFIDELEC